MIPSAWSPSLSLACLRVGLVWCVAVAEGPQRQRPVEDVAHAGDPGQHAGEVDLARVQALRVDALLRRLEVALFGLRAVVEEPDEFQQRGEELAVVALVALVKRFLLVRVAQRE